MLRLNLLRLIGLFGSCLALILPCANPARAEVVYKRSTAFFDIKGSTPDELDSSLNAKGPAALGSNSGHPGATRILFGGEASYLNRGTDCAIGSTTVTLDVKIILPRWRDRRRATPKLVAVWDKLASDIARHEDHHAAIALQYARGLDRAIKSLPPAPTCDRLQREVDRLTARSLAAEENAQRDFDQSEAIRLKRSFP